MEYNLKMTDCLNSVWLYKIFQYLMTIEGPFNQQWIEKQKEPWEMYIG
jgi:hypothetical protein